MSPALVELVLRSAKGRLVRSARLVRRPRYALGAVMGLLYLAFIARNATHRHGGAAFETAYTPDMAAGLQLVVALVFAMLATITWIVLFKDAGMRLGEAEAHVLLAAPLTRRDVLQYSVLKSQAAILGGSFVPAIMFGGPRALVRWPGYWLLLTSMDLFTKGARLYKMRTRELERSRRVRRRTAPLVALALAWIVVGAAAYGTWSHARPVLAAVKGAADLPAALGVAVGSPAAAWLRGLLLPFWGIAGAIVARAPRALAASWAVGLVTVALLNEWVVRSTAHFEDATLQLASAADRRRRDPKAAQLGGMSRRRRIGQAFRLHPGGAPWVAAYWASVRQVRRRPIGWLAAWIGGVLLLWFVLLAGAGGAAAGLGFGVTGALVGAGLAASVGVFGGTMYRNDLRSTLRLAEVLRTWPVGGRGLVLAHVLGAATFTTIAIAAALAFAVVSDVAARAVGGTTVLPDDLAASLGVPGLLVAPLLGAGAFLVLASLSLLSTALQNLVLLVFPGWVPTERGNRIDPAAFGQRLLFVLGLALVMIVALLPSAIAVGAVVLVQVALLGTPIHGLEVPLLGLLAALPPVGEAALLVAFAGSLWNRLDPAAEILESA